MISTFLCFTPQLLHFLCWHSEMEGKTEAWRIDLFASFFASISFYYQTFKEQPFLIFLLRKLLVHSRKKFCNVCQKQKIKRPFPHLCTLKMQWLCTVFENHRKSLIQHYEQSELHLHFERTKVYQKYFNFTSFENLYLTVKQCSQIGQFWLDKYLWKMPKFRN